jgi:hypothetical protein
MRLPRPNKCYALRPGRLTRRFTTGPNGEATLDLVSLDPSLIPSRWQQLHRQTGDPICEFPTTGQLQNPRDDFAWDSSSPFFRASGAATRGRSGAMHIPSS